MRTRYARSLFESRFTQSARIGLLAGLIALASSSAAGASDLLLDGATQTQTVYGESFEVSLSGAPLAPAVVFADLSPGPVTLFGEQVALGFTPFLTQLYVTGLDGGGNSLVTLDIPDKPSLAGKSVYLMGIVVDGGDPNGLDFSNGARLDVAPAASAGADRGAFLGESTNFDGGAAAGADGLIPPGTTIFWELLSSPAGSTAFLEDAAELYPRLTPDVKGNYTLRMSTTAGAVTTTDQVRLRAYELQWNALDGQWLPQSSFSVQGTLEGPPALGAFLNGIPILFAPDGVSFGPIPQSFAPGAVFEPLLFELLLPDGTFVRHREQVGSGAGEGLTELALATLATQLEQGALDELALVATAAVDAYDIEETLTDLGEKKIAKQSHSLPLGGEFVTYSAYATFLEASFGDADVALDAQAAGLLVDYELADIYTKVAIEGKILNVPYSNVGTATANKMAGSFRLEFSAANGLLKATISNSQVQLVNFNFDLQGFAGTVAQLNAIQNYVQSKLEDNVATQVREKVRDSLKDSLAELSLAGNLQAVTGLDVQLESPFSAVTHSGHGMTLTMDSRAEALSARPGSPPVTQFRSTPTAAVAFSGQTPGGGTYGGALSSADDLINQILAANTAAGLLEGDVSALLPGAGVSGGLTTAVMATLFPFHGFDAFPPDTPVGVRSHGNMPPVIRTTPGGPSLTVLETSGVELHFLALLPTVEVPILVVSVDTATEVDIDLAPNATFAVSTGNTVSSGQLLRVFPGPGTILDQPAVDFLTALIVPTLIDSIEAIPVPEIASEGLTFDASEIELIGALFEHLGFFGQLTTQP